MNRSAHGANGKPNRGWLLTVYAFLIGYRFWKSLRKPLELPPFDAYTDQVEDADKTKKFVEEIQGKARASLTTVGVLLGFSVAVLAALIGSKEIREALWCALHKPGSQMLAWCTFVGVFPPYLVIWAERIISGEKRELGWALLALALPGSLAWFLVAPVVPGFDLPRDSFPLAGFVMIIIAALFLIFSIEFYDSASGWRGGYDKAGAIWRLHVASIASHSALFGIPFALLGASLLLCFIEFWLGSISTCAALLVVTFKTEMERKLWDMKD